MSKAQPAKDVIERLERLQASGRLPEWARKTAATLAKRLSSQVRVTVLGPEGVGKSTLCNVLAGAQVLPSGQMLPTTMLRFGETAQLSVTLGDRSVRTLDGLDFPALEGLAPAYVEARAPLEGLRDLSLLEVVTDGTPAELAAATRWAATRTDIAIWVTTEFGPDEQAAWSKTPVELRDHAYLVLNRTDEMQDEARDARASALQPVVDAAFHAFFAVSALAAGPAGEKGSEADGHGCDALLRALKRHVSLAGQADLDGALMFLNRFEPKETPRPRARSSEPAKSGSAQAEQEETPAAVEEPPKLQLEQVALADQENAAGDAGQARSAALDALRGCARGVLSDWNVLGDNLAEAVLDRCVGTIEEVVETLPAEDRFHGPALQASDLIVLLQLEKGDGAADHAVSALLQLKREIEVDLAA